MIVTVGPHCSARAQPVELFQTGQPGPEVQATRILLVFPPVARSGRAAVADRKAPVATNERDRVTAGTGVPLCPRQQGVLGIHAGPNAHEISNAIGAAQRGTRCLLAIPGALDPVPFATPGV